VAPRSFPWIFRYEEELRVEGSDFLRKPLLRPVVLIRMAGARVGEHNVAALVDSGCDHVVAAPWVAQDIGVTPDSSREIRVRIGGASRTVRFADVSLHLLPPEAPLTEGNYDPADTHEWRAEVGFFTEWEAPPWSILLGQVGFFDQFTLTFNRESQALAVTAVDDFDRQFPQSPGIVPINAPRFRP